MTEGARRKKKTETVGLVLDHKPDGTEHGGGRAESADERRRTDGGVERHGGVERNGGADDKVGRTGEADGSVERQGQTRTADGGSRRR